MTTTEDISALIEAVQAGTADHGVFNIEWVADNPQVSALTGIKAHNAYDGSLDAALALHKAVLPEWHWRVFGKSANVFKMDDSYWAPNAAPSRAWLLAILRVLLSKHKDTTP